MDLDLLLIGAIIMLAALYLLLRTKQALVSVRRRGHPACGRCGCAEKTP